MKEEFAKYLAARLEGHTTKIETALRVCDFLSLHVDDGLDDLFTVFVNVLAGLLTDAEDIQGDFAKLTAPLIYGKEREQ